MKTIEEAARENQYPYNTSKFGMWAVEITEYISRNWFKKGVEFAQRWIPVEEEEIPLNEYVNLKDDEGCILAFKFDSEVERIQLLRTNPATHWRPINLK